MNNLLFLDYALLYLKYLKEDNDQIWATMVTSIVGWQWHSLTEMEEEFYYARDSNNGLKMADTLKLGPQWL